jgi:hypothetical protein
VVATRFGLIFIKPFSGCRSKSYEGENQVNLNRFKLDDDLHLNLKYLSNIVTSRQPKLFLKSLKIIEIIIFEMADSQ